MTSFRRAIHTHPDDGFFSGAWLFDETVIPQWLKRELKKSKLTQIPLSTSEWMHWYTPPNPSLNFKNKTSSLTDDEKIFGTSGAWLFRLNEMPVWFQNEVQHIPERTLFFNDQKENNTMEWMKWYTPIKHISTFKSNQNDDDEDAFYSGAWLFRLKDMPLWFQNEVRRIPEKTLFFNHQKEDNTMEWMKWYTPIKRISTFKPNQNDVNDDAFSSGAWLFDFSVAPKWLQSCLNSSPYLSQTNSTSSILGKVPPQSTSVKCFPISNLDAETQDENIVIESGAWLFDLNAAPSWFQSAISNIPKNKKNQMNSFYFHPMHSFSSITNEDVGFDSGAWLFDEEAMPTWFRKECFSFSMIPSLLKRNSNLSETKPCNNPTIQQILSNNPQTHLSYKPLEVDEDYGFENGGWLFDLEMAPVWLRMALKSSMSSFSTFTFPLKSNPISLYASTQPIQNQSLQPQSDANVYTNANQFKIRLRPISIFSTVKHKKISYCQLFNVDFTTGAWLFDKQRLPHWLKNEVKKSCSGRISYTRPLSR